MKKKTPPTLKTKDWTFYIVSWTNGAGYKMWSGALYYCAKRERPFCHTNGHISKRSLINALKKKQDYNFWSGLLSPEGKFYPCQWTQHNELAEYLNPELCQKYGWDKLHELGWQHLSDGDWAYPCKLTRKQMDFIFDWHEKDKKNNTLPDWWSDCELYLK